MQDKDKFAKDILEHVIIVGGFPRDILLEEKINDIDILINLRELNKFQNNHLIQCHNTEAVQSRDCKCLIWQRYLLKFHRNSSKKKVVESNMIDMHNCKYTLNSNFFITILLKDTRLKNAFSVQNQPKHGLYNTEIVNKIIYKKVNIDGQITEFYDTFDVNFEEEHDKTVYAQYHTKQRKDSIIGKDINGLNAFISEINEHHYDHHHHHGHDHNHHDEHHFHHKATGARKDGLCHGHNRLTSMNVMEMGNKSLFDDADFDAFGDKSRVEKLALKYHIYHKNW